MALELVNRDPVSDKWRYYNTDTKLFELNAASPTASQVQQYTTNNPDTPPEKWWGPLPGYTYPPEPAITNDTAGNKLANSPAAVSPEQQATADVSAGAPPSDNPSTNTLAANETLTQNESDLAGNQVPGQRAIVNNYDQSPFNSTANEANSVENANTTLQANNANNKKNTEPRINPLHNYPSYTYGISLHLLTKDEYNNLQKNQNFVPNRVLIASGGRYNSVQGSGQFIRNEYFKDDFYIDNLVINTVIGLNEHSRSTNAVQINFNIMEPYGVTLFDRLIYACLAEGLPSYIDIPYMIQVDFFASNDAGEIIGIIPGQTKRIPIRFTKFDIRATSKGSEYQVEAAPFNHQAFDQATCETPANFEITAGSLTSFFQSNEKELAFTTAGENSQRETEFKSTYDTQLNRLATQQQPGTQVYLPSILLGNNAEKYKNILSKDPVYKVHSYGSAINAWYDQLSRANKVTPGTQDLYFFKFHKDLEDPTNEKFASVDQNLPTKDHAMTDVANTKDQRKGNLGDSTNALQFGIRTFALQAHDSVDKVIDMVMSHTYYLQSQVVLPEDFSGDNKQDARAAYQKAKEAKSKDPLKWYKVVPSIELTEYDFDNKKWGRNITFNIIPYTVTNIVSDLGPQGTLPPPIKEYDYWYTGKSRDILDFNVDFQTLFFQQQTVYRNQLDKLYENPESNGTKTADGKADPKQNVTDAVNGDTIQPLKKRQITLNARARAAGGAINNKQVAVTDLMDSLYTTAGAQMVNAKLKIIGDPEYIKQDDIFFPPSLEEIGNVDSTTVDPRVIADGSLHMDKTPIDLQVNIGGKYDIDESTGLYQGDLGKIGPKGKELPNRKSLFSGRYRVNTVESVFSGGMFTQTLECYRIYNQPKNGDLAGKKDIPSQNREIAGETAITYTAPIGPDFNVNKSAQPDAVEPPATQGAPDNPPTVPDTQQQKLADVAANAPEQPVDAQNQPQATQPPTVEATPISEKLPTGVTQNNVGVYQYKGVNIGRTTDAAGKDSKNLSIIANAIDTGTTVTYIWSDPVSGLDKTVTYNGATGQTESIK